MVRLGLHDDPGGAEGVKQAEVGGLWVAPEARGLQVARRLVRAAAQQAFDDGYQSLYFWAGSDDGSAVAFASNLGFRPDSERRSARTEGAADETAMVLPLTEDTSSLLDLHLP
jgi:ribosomal protein S18 acetylase RimI-like enzyme